MAEAAVAETINTDSLRGVMKEEIKAAFDQARQDARTQAQQNAEARARAAAVNQVAQDPLAQTLRPYIEPVARELNLKTDMAMDAVRFYNRNADALKYEQDIENVVNTMASRGTPWDRDTAFKYIKGAKFDHFMGEEIKAREAKTQEAAQQGFAIGGSSVSGPQVGRLVGLGPNSKLEDLESALAGLTF